MSDASLLSGDPRLQGIADAAATADGGALPPVHAWNPPACGDIGLRIARDGTWFHQNVPIRRAALVKLFSRILRKDPDRTVLVTPVEMVVVDVEDAPFVAVEMRVEGETAAQTLHFRTNVDDCVTVDADHPLRFERDARDGLKPYVRVRHDLWALLARPLVYDLLAGATVREVDGVSVLGVASAGAFFPIASGKAIADLV